MTEPFLAVAGLWKVRGGVPLLRGVDLAVRRGEVMGLLGPSGAGKSTLLRCIDALEPWDRGLVTLGGVAIGTERRGQAHVRLREAALARQRARIGVVFQDYNLFPHMTVLRNVADAPIRVRRQAPDVAEARSRALLARMGLAGKADAYPRQLSGGQQQRVAIARALAMEPELMLFDEPTSALDPHLVGEVVAVIRDLAASGMTVLVVTHEVQFAREVADTVAIMLDGTVAEAGPPGTVLSHPRDPRVQAFLARALPSAECQVVSA